MRISSSKIVYNVLVYLVYWLVNVLEFLLLYLLKQVL